MKTLTKTLTALALAGMTAATAVAPASAQSVGFSFSTGDRGRADRVIGSYCDRNPRDRDCRDYRRGRFSDRDYHNFYNRHQRDLNPIAGAFGFTLGTIFGAAAANSNNRNNDNMSSRNMSSGHVSRCEARFRSYDVRTDTYLGNDGDRHRCTL